MLIVSTPLCFKRIIIFTTVQTKRGTKVYTVALYGFLEHEKLMGWRLEYIARMRGWDLVEFSQYKAYSEKITERIMLLGMKFQYSGKFDIINRMALMINDLLEKEKDMVLKIVYGE